MIYLTSNPDKMREAKEFFDTVLQEKSLIICNPVNEKYLQAKRSPAKKKIVCVETGEIFITATNAAKTKAVSASSLSECLNNKKVTAGGFHWKYIDD